MVTKHAYGDANVMPLTSTEGERRNLYLGDEIACHRCRQPSTMSVAPSQHRRRVSVVRKDINLHEREARRAVAPPMPLHDLGETLAGRGSY